MFRFSREQSIVNVAGVKFGGQPGELPSVLCGTIFYHGHRIVEDEEQRHLRSGQPRRGW